MGERSEKRAVRIREASARQIERVAKTHRLTIVESIAVIAEHFARLPVDEQAQAIRASSELAGVAPAKTAAVTA